MIRTDAEHQEAREQVRNNAEHLRRHEEELLAAGLTPAQAQAATAIVRGFQEQLEQEVAAYERMRSGQFGVLCNLEGMGQLLVGLRIYTGMTQRELAAKLGVHESQVSRWEKSEYHGVSIERAQAIIEAVGIDVYASAVGASPYEYVSGGCEPRELVVVANDDLALAA
jgi:DNA-binding XRE family transcriptional regulator